MAIKRQAMAKRILTAIPGTGGVISQIAEKAGVAWHTALKYIENNDKLQTAYRAESESVLDAAESKLIEKVKTGDMWAITYYLSKKGKDRGYGEQPTFINAGNLQINALLKNLTLEDLHELKKALTESEG
jgi:predicted transcriptional regulator